MLRRCVFALALLAVACGSDESVSPAKEVIPTPAPPGAPYGTLGEWHLFGDIATQVPAKGLLQYDVNAILFADFAQKYRFLYMPEGAKIAWKDKDRWDLPVGAILVKTFYYPVDARDASKGQQLIETRLLVHEPDGWVGYPYVYKDSQSEATLDTKGSTVPVDWTDANGAAEHEDYNIPNVFDCKSCHGTKPEHPLGPRTRQLDRDHDYGNGPENQIDHMASLGWFDVTPQPADQREHLIDPYGTGPVVERARSYLDANCGHCHDDDGKAASTGFWISYDHTDPATGDPQNWGVCKFPTSAGPASGSLTYDVVPGHADQSILIRRLTNTDPAVKMPPLLTRLVDDRGAQVITDWINGMPSQDCAQPTP